MGQTWGGSGGGGKGTEIERIMAKIEQDNRILAELDHSRSTTLGTYGGIEPRAGFAFLAPGYRGCNS